MPLRDEMLPAGALEAAIQRATRINVLAAKHFNAGQRGIFFSIGYLGWFVGPAVLVLTTLLLLCVLMRRQFFSAARLAVLGETQAGPGSGEAMRPESQ